MRKILYSLIIFFVLFSGSAHVNGQITIQNHSADIDQDGVAESVWYDQTIHAIVIVFSSPEAKRLVIPYTPGDSIIPETLYAVEDGLVIERTEPHKNERFRYVYQPDVERFRLVSVSVSDWSADSLWGEWSLDLSEQLLLASVTFDPQTKSPEKIDIRTGIYNEPVWLDEPKEYVVPDHDFFSEWRQVWNSLTSPDTVTYIGFNMDYDEQIFIGLKDGEPYSCWGGSDYGIHKGDTVIVYTGVSGYQPEGDKMLLMVTSFIHIERVYAPGKLTRFYETSRKEITYEYEGYHLEYWSYEERCPVDVAYFLAYTTEQPITRFLQEPGKLRVVFSDPEEVERDYNIKAELYNMNGEDQTFVCRLIMKHNDVFTDYFLWDDDKQIYELIMSDYSPE